MWAYSYIHEFLPVRLSPQIRELYVSTIITRFATSMIAIFEPIYLYQLGYGIKGILLFYLIFYIVYLFFIPLGAKLALYYGYQKAIIISSFFLVAYLALLLGLSYSAIFLPLVILTAVVRRALYWTSFHYDYAAFGDDQEEAREVSSRQVLEVAASATGPFFGGLILELSSFTILFIVVSAFILISNFPLMVTRERLLLETISYRDSFRRLFAKEKRRFVFSCIGFGEEFAMLILWPLFLYLFFIDRFLILGSIIAIATFLTVVVLLYVGRLTDRSDKRSILRTSTIFSALVWWLRPLINGVGAAFVVDALSRLTRRVLMIPQLSLLYERGRHRHHPMGTTLLFEMSLIVGKILIATVILLLFWLLPEEAAWSMAFIVAGLFTFLYLLV